MELLNPSEYWTQMSNRSVFMRTLFANVTPIIARDMKLFSKDPLRQSFDQLGNAHERFLKSLVDRIGNLSQYFEDVFLTLTFLRAEKSKTSLLYDELIDPERYYKYHYENFQIRMVTELDICAKLGNALFELNISERSMTPYKFYADQRMADQPSAMTLMEFANYLDNIKQDRHRKVHQGISKENKFDKVVFWETFIKAMGKTPEEHDMVLLEWTQTQIINVLSEINEVVRQPIGYVVRFLDSCLPQLERILLTHENS